MSIRAQSNRMAEAEISSATSQDKMKMLLVMMMMMIMIMAYMDRWNDEEDKIIVNFNATATSRDLFTLFCVPSQH